MLRYQLEARLCSTGAQLGAQIEKLRRGEAGHQRGSGSPANQRQLEQLSDLALLCRDLTPEEERVCRARYGGWSGGHDRYTRLVRPCEMRAGDGEEIVNPRPNGASEHVEVEGLRSRLPSFGQVAHLLKLTPHQVARRLQSGRAKIAGKIRALLDQRDFVRSDLSRKREKQKKKIARFLTRG